MPSTRLIAAAAILGLATPWAPAHAQSERADYASDASHVLGTFELHDVDHAPEAMAAAAQRFLQPLDDEQRRQVAHALHSAERREWTNLPARVDAGGLRLDGCDRAQVGAVCELLATLFSRTGFEKVRDIMLADDQLLASGASRRSFGTESFSIVIFGAPSATEPWAVQIDGHHMGINVSIHGERMTISPSFIGTQPHAFTLGTRSIRPLAGEIDGAHALVDSLSEAQRSEAIVGARREQLRTGPGHDHEVPPARGVSCASFDASQRTMLLGLIEHWVGMLPEDRARPRMAALADEVDRMHFAWSGPTAPRSDVSYAIQGPSLIIEYAGQDLGGDPLDHVHTMYRDPTNEYGGQVGAHDEHDH